MLFALLLALAADPDTFDAATRNPAWVSPRAKAAEAKRLEAHAREGDAWVGRCAAFLAEDYRLSGASRLQMISRMTAARSEGSEKKGEKKAPPREKGPLDSWREDEAAAMRLVGFHDEDAEVCRELERAYFEPREALHDAIYAQIVEGAEPRRMPELAHTLDEYERAHGFAAVAVLERHAAEFAAARALLGGEGKLEASGRVDVVDPRENAQKRAERSIRAALEHAATPEMRDRYLDYRRRLAADPSLRAGQQLGMPLGPFPMPPRNIADMERRRHAQEEAEVRAARGSGLDLAEKELFEDLLRTYREHRDESRRTDAEGKQKAARWPATRAALGPAVDDFFSRETEAIDGQIASIALDLELARLRPEPLPIRRDRGILRVSGTHPATEDGLTKLALRVEDAKGRVAWRCEKPDVVEGALDAPCLVADGVFAARGRYRVVVEGAPVGRIVQVVDVAGDELRVDAALDAAAKKLTVTRVLAAAGVELRFAGTPDSRGISVQLVNGTNQPLRPARETWAASARLEFDSARGWRAADEAPATAPEGGAAIAPGATAVWTWGARLPYGARAVLRVVVATAAKDGLRESMTEPTGPLATAGVSETLGSLERPCIEPVYPTRASDELDGLAAAAAGLFGVNGRGIVRIEGTTRSLVVPTTEPLRDILSSPDGRLVGASGSTVVLLSRDGGAHFGPVDAGVPEPRVVGFAGDDLLVGSREGALVRVAPDGKRTTVEVPKRATWHRASFDGDRGALVGACDSLLLTSDGGRSWEARTERIWSVLALGGRLLVVGEGGVRASGDGGKTFETLVPRQCFRLESAHGRVAVTCLPDGVTHSPVLVSRWPAPFEPLPSELATRVWGLAVSPVDGHVTALGGSLRLEEQDGVLRPVLDSPGAKRAVVDALQPTPPWRVMPKLPGRKVP